MKFSPPLSVKLVDPALEAVRQNIDRRIAELQQMKAVDLDVIRDVAISVNGATMVPHKLGRAPIFVGFSVPRVTPASFPAITAGVICELGPTAFTSLAPLDRARVLQIGAFGFSVPITIDVLVM